MAKQVSRGAVVILHGSRSQPKPWHECLDAAVEAHFAQIRCTTVLTRSGHKTSIVSTKPGDGLIKPALAKRIQAFVAGFMACEDSL